MSGPQEYTGTDVRQACGAMAFSLDKLVNRLIKEEEDDDAPSKLRDMLFVMAYERACVVEGVLIRSKGEDVVFLGVDETIALQVFLPGGQCYFGDAS